MLTVVVPSPDIIDPAQIEEHYPADAIILDPEAVLYHMDRVKVLDPRTVRAVRALGVELPENSQADDVRALRAGIKHLVGRVDMHLKLRAIGARTIVHRDPEAFLHPKWCCELGDLFIGLDHETHS